MSRCTPFIQCIAFGLKLIVRLVLNAWSCFHLIHWYIIVKWIHLQQLWRPSQKKFIFQKKPKHIAFCIQVKETSNTSIPELAARLALWSLDCGIQYISFYEASGKLKQKASEFQEYLSHTVSERQNNIDSFKSLFGSFSFNSSIVFKEVYICTAKEARELGSWSDPQRCSFESQERENIEKTEQHNFENKARKMVLLLSREDGYPDIVRIVQEQVAAAVSTSNMEPMTAEFLLSNTTCGQSMPSVDLVIQVGHEQADLNGFPPLLLKNAEIFMNMGWGNYFPYCAFFRALMKFSGTTQRYGS